MIEFKNVSKYYGTHKVINQISFKANKGETLVLLGESGCGKTTTLKMINKLIEPTSGEIFVENKSIENTDSIELRRNIGYVIQDKGLFPHYTVRENVELLPTIMKWNKKKIYQSVNELLELVELNIHEFENRYPYELSGGQQQRVSLARALAVNPEILLMDEPFGALDNITRKQVRFQFKKIERNLSKTIILVTHDISEAIELGDKICLMNKGKIAQLGTPFELLFNPANDYVKDFLKNDKFINELQLITLADIILLIRPLDIKNSNGIKINSSSNMQVALETLFINSSNVILNITDNVGKTLKSCNINELLSAFIKFRLNHSSEI